MRARTAGGNGNQSAVMPSELVTEAEGDHLLVRAIVAHHADALDRQDKDPRRLLDVVVEAPASRILIEVDGVGGEQRVKRPARERRPGFEQLEIPPWGNGCRPTISSGNPSSRPTARTSSLNSSRSGL